MRKKLVLKNWVVFVLVFIGLIAFMVLGGDCDNMELFVKSKIIAFIVLTIITLILKKFSNIFE